MGDVKSTKGDHPLDFFEMHSSRSPTKGQINDEPEINYPKLLVRASDTDETHSPSFHEHEKMDLFSHDTINGTIQVPDEEDVIMDFLLSVSSSSPKQDDFETQNERNMMDTSRLDFCAENLNGDCNLLQSEQIESPKETEMVGTNRVLIETAAPIESVKAAVSKFGGILDWKAHRVQTVERRKLIEQELGQAREEIPIYKKQYENTEASKIKVLKELDTTKRLVEELKLNLERTHTEEQQAKQDDELVRLRVEELEQGIEDEEASIAAKTQLEVARSRHLAAASEVRIVRNELEQLRKDYELLVLERERAIKKAEVSVSASKEVERLVEEMMIELIDVKESLEFAHGAHLEAEEGKLGAQEGREREVLECERKLREGEAREESLRERILSKKSKKNKLDSDKAKLVELKTELAAYVETKPGLDIEKDMISKELDEVRGDIDKALIKINKMKRDEEELKAEIERERSEICAIRKREDTKVAIVASLEGKLSESRDEISSLRVKERERGERIVELPMKLELAGQESDQAKMLAQLAREEWQKQKEDWEKAKAEAKAMENKLIEAEKEKEAAKASENLALAAIDASKVSENDGDNLDKNVITLSLEEYYVLTKRAHKAQENANAMVASVMSQIEVAKESESNMLQKLKEVDLEMVAQKEALVVAIHKAENAKESKVAVEQELRILRAENEKRRKEYVQESRNPRLSFENSNVSSSFIDMAHTVVPKNEHLHENNTEVDSSAEVKAAKKKKKFFLPRMFMFLARRKAHASKSK